MICTIHTFSPAPSRLLTECSMSDSNASNSTSLSIHHLAATAASQAIVVLLLLVTMAVTLVSRQSFEGITLQVWLKCSGELSLLDKRVCAKSKWLLFQIWFQGGQSSISTPLCFYDDLQRKGSTVGVFDSPLWSGYTPWSIGEGSITARCLDSLSKLLTKDTNNDLISWYLQLSLSIPVSNSLSSSSWQRKMNPTWQNCNATCIIFCDYRATVLFHHWKYRKPSLLDKEL